MLLNRKERNLSFIILIIASILLCIDIYDDLSHGSTWMHIAEEIVIVLFCLIALAVWLKKYFNFKEENIVMRKNLEKTQDDLSKYKAETAHLAKGLSHKIEQQMSDWMLTPAEKEISWLLLKGLSTKEIAEIRQTSEKTIKHQQNSIYQKSNLSGRAELSAFFLEDLFVI